MGQNYMHTVIRMPHMESAGSVHSIIIVPFKWLRFQNWYFHSCPFNFYFDMFSGRKTLNMYEKYIFWSDQCSKLECQLLLSYFCSFVYAEDSKSTQEFTRFSGEEDVEKLFSLAFALVVFSHSIFALCVK